PGGPSAGRGRRLAARWSSRSCASACGPSSAGTTRPTPAPRPPAGGARWPTAAARAASGWQGPSGGGAASPSTRPAELATHAAVTALVVAGIVWRLGGAFVYVLHAALVPALALGAHPVGGGPTRPAGRSRGRAGRGGH